MNILICVSHVPDTTTKVRFTGTKLTTENIQWIINPWDELTLTRAIELKEAGAPIDQIMVATVGDQSVEPTLRKALAIGADKAFRVDFTPEDAGSTALQLQEVAKKAQADLVFTGFESADYNGGLVGAFLAESLGRSFFSSVNFLDIKEGAFILNREMNGMTEVIKSKNPMVVSVQKGIAINPRIPAMRGIMMARTKPLEVIAPTEMNSKVKVIAIALPAGKAKVKLFVPEQVNELIDALHSEAKVL
jgi:electron transfer flavoprotein beta subunit